MDNFKYINIIRKPDGRLREWEEYNCLAYYERACDLPITKYDNPLGYTADRAIKIKAKEVTQK